ncbi:hypothetical protein HKD37_18G049829 [Glycine soja]
MRTEKRIQTFNISRIMHFSRNSVVSSVGRNLEKYQLDGVIFGCKKSTLQECQAKQLFGYSFTILHDKKLHGIFEASSKGKMYIDPYVWIDDDLALERTKYPAHVSLPISTNQTLNSHGS